MHFEIAISKDPSRSFHWLSFGRALLNLGRYSEAICVFRRLSELAPNLADGHFWLGNALKASGDLEGALKSYGTALDLKPDFAQAHFNLANVYLARSQLDEAASALRQAIGKRPQFSEAYNHLGNVLLCQGKVADAIAAYRQAVASNPKNASAHNNLGSALKGVGEVEAAIECFRGALQLRPQFAEAHNNVGAALYEKDSFSEAIAHYRQAIDINPQYADAYHNLGNALMRHSPSNVDFAIDAFKKAIELAPDHIESYDHLGLALCEGRRISEAFSWFTRAATLRYGRAGAPQKTVDHKATHDEEQLAYLAINNLPRLGQELYIAFGEALSGPAISPKRADTTECDWLRNEPKVVVVDNLLTEPALDQLRLFCLSSTIWREAFDEGYLGARPESGFACPLVAQIAEELPRVYPRIFRDYPVLYSWAFKYDSTLRGIKLHADFAAVNVNFWITPDEANLNPEGGGLVIWDVAAPLDWDFEVYNRDESRIRKFLAESSARPVKIPYRSNRAVIFDLDLFHETDRLNFRPGYLYRRVNITLLYGRRGQT